MKRSRRVAIVGGGAAGMICAHLLDGVHDVTVFERQAILGGHVRTLNRNVSCPALTGDTVLDAGVIEFSPEHFPAFHRLLNRLDVPLVPVPAQTGFIPRSGRAYASLGKIEQSRMGPLGRTLARARLWRLGPEFRRFRQRAAETVPDALEGRRLGEFLETGPASQWLRLLLRYAYSMPLERIDDMPAILAVPTLLRFTGDVSWTSIRGGAYRYIERIVEGLRGRIVAGAEVREIRRDTHGVAVDVRGATPEHFDAVVIATTPDQVLRLLADPTAAERRRFAGWRSNDISTTVHRDRGMYERRRIPGYSEFDVFEDPPGYSAHLNRLCGVPPEHRDDFFLSLGMDAEIDPAQVLHRQPHRTPDYSVEAFASRPEIIENNGENHTWFAGAWLGDGLHEGATVSALRVSKRLGGDTLPEPLPEVQLKKRSPVSVS